MKLTGVEECRGSTVTVLPPSQSCKFGLRLWTARDFALVDMLQACISEFMQKNGRKKRTAKNWCMTNVTGLLIACFVKTFT